MRRGWFRIDGQQDGDRTLKEQLTGLAPALAAAKGRTVLDLGCAEGLISRECLRAGATFVRGIEIIDDHVKVGRKLCRDLPCEFVIADLDEEVEARLGEGAGMLQFDVVLALAILHKLSRPERALEYIGRVTRELAVVRYPGGARGAFQDQRSRNRLIDVVDLLARYGLRLSEEQIGPRGEITAYFRR